MRYLNDAKYVVSALLFLILLFSGLLYRNLNARVDAGDNPVIGTLTFKRKVIQRKYSAEVVWEEIENSEDITNGDTIRTQEGSNAVLTLNDGTKIELNENSMIVLDLSDENLNLNFAYGSVSAKRSESSAAAGSKMSITSGESAIEMGNGDLKLDKTGEAALNVKVEKGEAKIRVGDQESTIQKDQLASLQKNQIQIKPLNLKLNSPSDNQYLSSITTTTAISFSWEKTQANTVNLQVAKDPGFRSIQSSVNIRGQSTSLRLGEGNYYWRINAKNPKTGTTEFSETRSLIILTDSLPNIVSPSQNAQFNYVDQEPFVQLQWKKSGAASAYRWEVATDASFQNILESQTTSSLSSGLDNLKEGEYFARVRSIPAISGLPPRTSSTVRFRISKQARPEKPNLYKPADDTKLPLNIFRQVGSLFTWSSGNGVEAFELEFSKSSDFKPVLFSTNTRNNTISVSQNWQADTYYWRVRAVSSSGVRSEYSDVSEFKILELGELKLKEPVNGAKLGVSRGGSVDFQWDEVEALGDYQIEIAKDRDFRNIVRKETSSRDNKRIPIFEEGNYFWRVKLVSQEGKTILGSNSFQFSIQENVPVVSLISPTIRQRIDMSARDSLDFRWKVEGEAVGYSVSLWKIDGGKRVLLSEKNVRENRYVFRELNQLSEGDFEWEVTPQYRDANGKALSASPAKGTFSIALYQNFEAPKILTPKEIYVE